MNFPEGIEGDYIESKKDNLIFDVKGLLHPKDRKICFVRFYPNPTGDRLKNNLNYSKLYDLNERYDFLKNNYPQYLFYSEELDLELQGVKNEDIKKIYTPRNYFRRINQENTVSNIENLSKELCNLFITEGNLDEKSIGISGSTMVGLNKTNSDIDIIIYGTNTSLQFQAKLELLFNKSKNIRMYNLKEYEPHFIWRVGGSDLSFDDFIRSEQRKLHQGKFKDSDFFIRYIKSPEDWNGNFYDYKFKNYGRIRLKATILDATDSIFTPCSYKVDILKILDYSKQNYKMDPTEIKELNSFRGRFCEQAKIGEKVLVEGKLEKVIYKNESIAYRILLENQIYDKMIILP